MKSKSILGSLLLTITAVIWGTAFVAQRVGMDSIEPLTFGAARMLLAAVAVGVAAYIMERGEKKNPPVRTGQEQKAYEKNTWIGGICCGVLLTAASSFQQMGIVYTTAGKAGFITTLYILLVPVIGFLFLKKKNSALVWIAVAIGMVGMYLLSIDENFVLTKGDALVAVCALFFSFHILCCDYFVRRANPIKLSAIQFAVASFISALMAFITEEPGWDKIVSAGIPILYSGLMSGGLGYTLQIVGQKYTPPAAASLILSGEAIFAALAGALMLRERMTSREILGGVILFAAVILVQLPAPGKKKA